MTTWIVVLGSIGGVLLVVALWLGICAILSYQSGWHRLAGKFPSTSPAEGTSFSLTSGLIGTITYASALSLTVGHQGLRMAVLFPFRFQSPPLFIPWTAVVSADVRGRALSKHALVSLRDGCPAITIYGRAGQKVANAFAGYLNPSEGTLPVLRLARPAVVLGTSGQ